uniref:Uncharacterized protein n=1 Tax=Anguilla anguilla TaxID=7936 RepID=A0A0E9U0S9_ANGAN
MGCILYSAFIQKRHAQGGVLNRQPSDCQTIGLTS